MFAQSSLSCNIEYQYSNSKYACIVQSLNGFHKTRRLVGRLSTQYPYRTPRIEALESNGVQMAILPNFNEILPDLEEVTIINAKLREIWSEHLKSFGRNLKLLNLNQNDIEVLEKNLFIHNPNLITIKLEQNKIRHVVDGAFNGLDLVMDIDLDLNPCYESDMRGGLGVVREIETQCKDKFMKRIDDLEKEVEKLKKPKPAYPNIG